MNDIRFKYLQPHMATDRFLEENPWAETFRRRSRPHILCDSAYTFAEFERINTESDIECSIREALEDLLEVPRMSSLAIALLLNCAVRNLREDECFLNVGVWHGFSLFAAMIANETKRCIGVDNFSQFGGPRHCFFEYFKRYAAPRHEFYDSDYMTYLTTARSLKLGVYFYDGPHSYQEQLNALHAAEPYYAKDCLIFVDDVNWQEPRLAIDDFLTSRETQYQKVFDVSTAHNCHPTYWNGLIILRRL